MTGAIPGPVRTAPQTRTATPVRTRARGPKPPLGNQALLRKLQAKLTIGAVEDPLEHEADAVAEQVMRAPDPGAGPPRLSRKCDSCEAEEPIRAKGDGGDMSGEEAPAEVGLALGAPGRPLDAGTRAFFEPRLDADLSDVRIHADAQAAKSAQTIGAVGYTVGNDIVFGKDRYSPDTDGGRRLIAHELAHVIQQTGAARRTASVRRAPDDPPAEGAAPAPAAPAPAANGPAGSGGGGGPANLEYDFDPTEDAGPTPTAGDGQSTAPPSVARSVMRQASAPAAPASGAAAPATATAQTLTWADFPPVKARIGGMSAQTGVRFGWKSDGTGFSASFNRAQS